VLAGCSGGGPAGTSGDGVASGKASNTLESKRGDYMPPLDGGRLEIAAPKGWDWANPGGNALVAFKPKDAEINDLPRVLLSVADSEFPGIDDLTAKNKGDFVQQVASSVAEQKPKKAVREVTLNGRWFAGYQLLAKRRNQVVAQNFLVTVAASRVYTLRLEAYQTQMEQAEAALDVIAASMKFSGGGESAGDVGEAATDVPQETVREPQEPAEAKAKE